MKHTKSQSALILSALQQGDTLTSLQALDRFKCFRLASRISDLNKQGHNIQKKMIKVDSGKSVAEYYLETTIITIEEKWQETPNGKRLESLKVKSIEQKPVAQASIDFSHLGEFGREG